MFLLRLTLLSIIISLVVANVIVRLLHRYNYVLVGPLHVENPGFASNLGEPLIILENRETGYRINNATIPTNYDVHLTTNVHVSDFAFTGEVIIHLKALEATNFIQVHYKQLQIDSVKLSDSEGNEINVTDKFYDKKRELFSVYLSTVDVMEIDQEYTLEIEYRGKLREDEAGFYRSSYVNEAGETPWLAATQFQSTDARHAFPCYDEPGIRAPFRISITHHQSYTAISNMPGTTGEPSEDGMVTTTFEETPPIQSYLIAFVVSDFTYIENKPENHRVFARPEAISAGDAAWALEVAIKVLNDQQFYFSTSHNLTKLDQISVPDFNAEAMENWGLVTYQESTLLWNSTRDGLRAKNNILTAIAHEICHQFFGNLVAPKWWSYLWLNEGFATLFKGLSADRTYPEFRNMDLMVVNDLQGSMITDSYASTRPMTNYGESPSEVSSFFDTISYEKSASVLRMWLYAITEKTFVRGLTYYLKEMKFQAADSDDLARNLDKAAHEANTLPDNVNFKTIVDSWSLQKGFPVVTVKRLAGKLYLSQQRFYLSSKGTPDSDRWWIPLNFASAGNPRWEDTAASVWMMANSTLEIGQSSDLTWDEDDYVILNKQQTGYYRVDYDAKGWELIMHALVHGNFSAIHVLNRAQVIDDIFNLARSGRQNYATVFALAGYLQRELDYAPWHSANNALVYLDRLLAASPAYEHFRHFVREIVTPLFEKYGVEDKDDEVQFDRRARTVAIEWACRSGVQQCLDHATEALKQANEENKDISVDQRTTVYCAGLRGANRDDWDTAWKRTLASSSTSFRSQLISALGCSFDEETLDFYLKSSLDRSVKYSISERSLVLSSVLKKSAKGVDVSMNFIDANYMKIDEIFIDDSVSETLNGISTRINSENLFERFEKLLDKLKDKGRIAASAKIQMLNNAVLNVDWLRENEVEILQYFTYLYSSASNVFLSFVLLLVSLSFSHIL